MLAAPDSKDWILGHLIIWAACSLAWIAIVTAIVAYHHWSDDDVPDGRGVGILVSGIMFGSLTTLGLTLLALMV